MSTRPPGPDEHERPERPVSSVVRLVMVAMGMGALLFFFPPTHPVILAMGAYALVAAGVFVLLVLRPHDPAGVWANVLLDPFFVAGLGWLMGPATSPMMVVLLIPLLPITIRSGPRYARVYIITGLLAYNAVLWGVTLGWLPPLDMLSPVPPRPPSVLEAVNASVLVGLTAGVSYPYLLFLLRLQLEVSERELAARAEKDEAQSRTEALERQLQEVRALESLGRLAGGVAHDFNNLLAVVLGNVQLLAQRGRDPDAIEEIERATREAQELTAQLLAFSHQPSLGREATPLGPVLEGLVQSWNPQHPDHPVELHLDAAETPALVDGVSLERALLALLHNAREASPEPGPIHMGLSLAREVPPEVARSAGGRFAVVRVEDHGHGMESEVAQRAFEPFFTTKALGRGEGLGLSMVYGTVRQQGGAVRIHSRVGEGTRVEVFLPLEEAGDTAPRSEPPPEELTILVVDDEVLVRRMTSRVLRQSGYQVVQAGSGHEALSLLRLGQGLPDLVLTDVRMPDLSGPELARRVGEIHPVLPVVFMSGYVDELEQSGTLSRDQVLAKPFSVDALRRHVRAGLGRPRLP